MEVQLLILSLFNKFCIVFSQPLYAHKFVTRLLISDFSFVLNILFYNVSCSASYMLFDLFVYPLSLRFLLKKNWLKKLDNTYLWHQNKKGTKRRIQPLPTQTLCSRQALVPSYPWKTYAYACIHSIFFLLILFLKTQMVAYSRYY